MVLLILISRALEMVLLSKMLQALNVSGCGGCMASLDGTVLSIDTVLVSGHQENLAVSPIVMGNPTSALHL